MADAVLESAMNGDMISLPLNRGLYQEKIILTINQLIAFQTIMATTNQAIVAGQQIKNSETT